MARAELLPILQSWAVWARHKDRPVAPSTVDIYLVNLRALARFGESRGRSLEELTADDLDAFTAMHRHQSDGTVRNRYSAFNSFFTYLMETGNRSDNPVEHLRPKGSAKRRVRRIPSQQAQRLAKLTTRDAQIVEVVTELRGIGASIREIFSIRESTPVGLQVHVQNGRGDQRLIPLSPESREHLNRWGGRLPIGPRAFQRRLEQVGLSPRDLTDPATTGISVGLHPTLEAALHNLLEAKAFEDSVGRAMNEVRAAVDRLATELGLGSAGNLLQTPGSLAPYFENPADAEHFRNLLSGGFGLLESSSARRRFLTDDSSLAREATLFADMCLRTLHRRMTDFRLNEAILADYGRQVTDISDWHLRKMGHFQFQNWVIQRFHGTMPPRLSGDGGIDGYTPLGYPIQVKQSENVMRPDLDGFETAVERSGKPMGFMVAFSFTKGAYEEAERARREGKADIRLVTVKELLRRVPV